MGGSISVANRQKMCLQFYVGWLHCPLAGFMKKKLHARGVVSGLLAAISYGLNPLFAMPMILAGIGVNSILFYRYFFATLIYGCLLKSVRKIDLRLSLREFAVLLFMALLYSFSSITLFSSFQYIDVGISCTLLFVYPTLVAIISALFFGEKMSLGVVMAIGLTTAGVVLLSRGSLGAELNPTGLCQVFISALLYALYIIGVRQLKTIRHMRSEKLNFYIMLMGLMVYVCNLHFCTNLQIPDSPLLWVCAVLLAIIPTIVSLESLTVAIKLIGATRTAILGALEPLTAIIVGVSFFGEQLSWRIILGFFLIVIGVLLVVSRRPMAS